MTRLLRNRLIALGAGAALVVAALVSPALGGPSLRSLVKKEVAKQLAGKQGPAGTTGTAGPAGTQGSQGPAGTSATLPGGTLPAGLTLRGAAAPGVSASGVVGPTAVQGISFGGYRLPSRPRAHVVDVGATAPPECPGTSEAPSAQSGHLCIYVTVSDPATDVVNVVDPSDITPVSGISQDLGTDTETVLGNGTVATFGFSIGLNADAGGDALFTGTWAVTS